MRKAIALLSCAVMMVLAGAVLRAVEPVAREGARPIEKTELFYTELPRLVNLSPDGKAEIAWTTRQAAPPGLVYVGARIPDRDALGPRFLISVAESGDPATAHKVTVDLKAIANPKIDTGDWRAKGGGEVVFRVESYDSKQKRARLWDGRFGFRLDGDTFTRRPCVSLGPFVANVGGDSAVVWLETDTPVAARVEISASKNKARVFEQKTPASRHEITLSGLKPDTRYKYSVTITDAEGKSSHLPEYVFRTAPGLKSMRPIRFVVMADARSSPGGPEQSQDGVNTAVLRALMNAASRTQPDFMFFTGDLFNGYTTEPADFENQMRTWFRTAEPFGHNVPIYTTTGNHDTLQVWYDDGVFYDRIKEESGEAAFARLAVNPKNGPPPEDPTKPPYLETVYSFDVGPVHCAVMNTDYWYTKHPQLVSGNLRGNLMAGQLAWLDADLAAARKHGAKFLFVFAHEVAFPNGGHVEDAMWYDGKKPEIIAMRNKFWGTLVKYRARAGFFAHEHNYSRTLIDRRVDPKFTHPVWQIVAGNAGAPPIIRDKNVPWADNVKVFSTVEHYLVVTVHPATGRIEFRTVDGTGRTIDAGSL